jgi:cytochrome c oxidase assembly protein subunit 15
VISRRLRLYTLFMVVATFCLVIAGDLVTSTGSALAVPYWPLSFGQLFPPMVGGVFYEHGHRLVAMAVGLLTIILAFWLWFQAEEPLLKKAGWIALALVCAQGVLGGVTVLLKLPAVTSIGHACLGQVCFSWISCIAAMAWSASYPAVSGKVFLNPAPVALPAGKEAHENDVKRLRRLALLTTALVFLQLVIGAIYRHIGILLHLHFLGAALVFIHGVLLYTRVKKSAAEDIWFLRPTACLMGLIVIQIGLGLCTWQYPTVLDATAHAATGALILATSSVLSLESFRRVA